MIRHFVLNHPYHTLTILLLFFFLVAFIIPLSFPGIPDYFVKVSYQELHPKDQFLSNNKDNIYYFNRSPNEIVDFYRNYINKSWIEKILQTLHVSRTIMANFYQDVESNTTTFSLHYGIGLFNTANFQIFRARNPEYLYIAYVNFHEVSIKYILIFLMILSLTGIAGIYLWSNLSLLTSLPVETVQDFLAKQKVNISSIITFLLFWLATTISLYFLVYLKPLADILNPYGEIRFILTVAKREVDQIIIFWPMLVIESAIYAFFLTLFWKFKQRLITPKPKS